MGPEVLKYLRILCLSAAIAEVVSFASRERIHDARDLRFAMLSDG